MAVRPGRNDRDHLGEVAAGHSRHHIGPNCGGGHQCGERLGQCGGRRGGCGRCRRRHVVRIWGGITRSAAGGEAEGECHEGSGGGAVAFGLQRNEARVG